MNPVIQLILILRKSGWKYSNIDWYVMRKEYDYSIEEINRIGWFHVEGTRLPLYIK